MPAGRQRTWNQLEEATWRTRMTGQRSRPGKPEGKTIFCFIISSCPDKIRSLCVRDLAICTQCSGLAGVQVSVITLQLQLINDITNSPISRDRKSIAFMNFVFMLAFGSMETLF